MRVRVGPVPSSRDVRAPARGVRGSEGVTDGSRERGSAARVSVAVRHGRLARARACVHVCKRAPRLTHRVAQCESWVITHLRGARGGRGKGAITATTQFTHVKLLTLFFLGYQSADRRAESETPPANAPPPTGRPSRQQHRRCVTSSSWRKKRETERERDTETFTEATTQRQPWAAVCLLRV